MTSERLIVRLRGRSFEVEASGETQADLERELRAGIGSIRSMLPLLYETESTPAHPLKPASADAEEQAPSGLWLETSVGEVLRKSNVNSDADRCLVVSHYLFKQGIREFTHRDVLKLYDEAGIPHPANIYNVLDRLVKRALLRLSGEKEGVKSFTMTQSGVSHYETLVSAVKTEVAIESA